MKLAISPDLALPVQALTETFAIHAERSASKSNAAAGKTKTCREVASRVVLANRSTSSEPANAKSTTFSPIDFSSSEVIRRDWSGVRFLHASFCCR